MSPLIFVAIAVVVFHLLPATARKAWLLLTSYVFYASIAWQFVPVLALLSLATYALGTQIRPADKAVQAWPLWIGIALNVGALIVLRQAFPLSPFEAPFAVIGLSFYTLQAISYLADLHSGTLKARASLWDLCLYLAYFPKLLAGPIERAGSFIGKVNAPRPIDDDTLQRAFTLIVAGIGRKFILADPLRMLIPSEAFSAPGKLGAAMLAASLFGFAVVLYNDFAGYTALARGVSLLFGIELSPNFARPFFATSFTDFWNRWHITLSMWLRDYIYLPLSRALLRRDPSLWNVPNLIVPPMVTMLASGYWHGGSAHMLLWGGLHGVFLVAERVLALARPRRRPEDSPVLKPRPSDPSGSGRHGRRWAQPFVVLIAIGAFAFFRMEIGVAFVFWRRVLTAAPGALPDLRWLLPVAATLWLDIMQARHGDEVTFDHWPRLARAALLAAAMVACFLLTRAAPPAPFIYRGF